MRSKLTTLLTVVGAVTVLVLAGNTLALATTGKALLAGKVNVAGKPTTIKRTTPGAALALRTSSLTSAPLVVNGRGRVANLNADKVDGRDAASLGVRARTWTWSGSVNGPSLSLSLSGLGAGTYLISYSFAMTSLSSAPSGTPVRCSIFYSYNQEIARTTTVVSTVGGYAPALSGSGIFSPNPAADVVLGCSLSVSASWTIGANNPIRITAVPVDASTAGAFQ